MKRPAPVSDPLSAPFWEAARNRRLEVQRCLNCRRYFLPAVAFCTACRSSELRYEAVSGEGRVHHYSEVRSGARQDFFERQMPYLIGAVELVEQDGLMLYTNFPEHRLEELKIGAPVEVFFEEIDERATIPQFRLKTRTAGSDR
jgi:uncharacterized OB-fold protein